MNPLQDNFEQPNPEFYKHQLPNNSSTSRNYNPKTQNYLQQQNNQFDQNNKVMRNPLFTDYTYDPNKIEKLKSDTISLQKKLQRPRYKQLQDSVFATNIFSPESPANQIDQFKPRIKYNPNCHFSEQQKFQQFQINKPKYQQDYSLQQQDFSHPQQQQQQYLLQQQQQQHEYQNPITQNQPYLQDHQQNANYNQQNLYSSQQNPQNIQQTDGNISLQINQLQQDNLSQQKQAGNQQYKMPSQKSSQYSQQKEYSDSAYQNNISTSNQRGNLNNNPQQPQYLDQQQPNVIQQIPDSLDQVVAEQRRKTPINSDFQGKKSEQQSQVQSKQNENFINQVGQSTANLQNQHQVPKPDFMNNLEKFYCSNEEKKKGYYELIPGQNYKFIGKKHPYQARNPLSNQPFYQYTPKYSYKMINENSSIVNQELFNRFKKDPTSVVKTYSTTNGMYGEY